MPTKILVIDDEESMCNFMEIMLAKEGYNVDTVLSGCDGVSLLKEKNYDLVIADLNMPEMSGIDVLKQIRSFKREQDLVVMTAYASVETAIEAMKHGAADYITKPFKVDEIKLTIEKIITRRQLQHENKTLKKQLQSDNSFDNFVGASEAVAKLKNLARRIASSDSTVLVRGESGTGKDLIAKAIHHHSPRCGGPFITINCAALPEQLLESELFGHKKGSFTGAIRDKEGLFKAADGGTFFLDEIGNTSLAIQVKLLRVLEDKTITPVGEIKSIEVDVRLIAATNSDLEEEVSTGRFRADLFYRLNVIPLHIPPLRERDEDIKLLTDYFINKYCGKLNTAPKSITPEATELLMSYHWPGNVRELENTIERAVLLNRTDTIGVADLGEKILSTPPVGVVQETQPATPTLESIEKAYIHYIMSQTDGKKTKAARILGIDTSTLYRKLERYDLKETSAPRADKPRKHSETK
ncbi:MAG: sigma-54-dependent Fis family transcriptional regulator [candidate division Zixibacteria bacterium]|nr:sigma-54-dependent Fis family transcriptional regulator [candidate division Zixibacteria bacterium]